MKWKVTLLLVLIALPGVIATSWLALPLLIDVSKITVPLQTLQIVAAAQSGLLVFIAAFIGTIITQRVGLSSPAISALAGGGKLLKVLRPQLVPGFVGGFIGALVIVSFYVFLPESLRSVQPDKPLPLTVRVLYGGITEEILLRWGLMSLLVWVASKVLQKDQQHPTPGIMYLAIVLSALAFGLSHLPSVALSVPALSVTIVAYITIGNTVFGLVAGYLFWRYGLEAAIAAHVSAHLLAYIIGG